MTDDRIYQEAQRRLNAIIDERRELEAFIAMYRKLAKASADEAPTERALVVCKPDGSIDILSSKPATTEEIVSASMEIIAANNAPMVLGAIFDALLARGIVVGGKIPRNNLGAKLSADPRLVTIKGRGWWFKDEPIPGSYPRDLEVAQNEKGPADWTEPSHMNGAADSYSA